MARYWVGDTARERHAPVVDRAAGPESPTPTTAAHRPERVTDALRRTLAGNVTADDAGD